MKSRTEKTDVLIIGGGPGGYAAAFLAADLGLKVTLVDSEKNPGGVCLHRGCIPSKAFLHATRFVREAREASRFGIEFKDLKIDLDALRKWKEEMVEGLTGGLGLLSGRRNIWFIQGFASFQSNRTGRIHTETEDFELEFDYAIIATGSRPLRLPYAPVTPRIWDSTDALNLPFLPGKLLVVGGGYIGLELGTVYASLGSRVTLMEGSSELMQGVDRDLISPVQKRIQTLFHEVYFQTIVHRLEDDGKQVHAIWSEGENEKKETIFDAVLVAIGRRPSGDNIGLENTVVKTNPDGSVQVDEKLRTRASHIFAIGDVAGGPMLAHKATHEGRIAAEVIAGRNVNFKPKAIPAVAFTDPEIAWCGVNEKLARERGFDYRILKFPWAASGRALTLNAGEGFTKLFVDRTSGRILGMGIVGQGAGELISEGVLAIETEAKAEQLQSAIHPHPALSETIMETAESFFGQATHFIGK